MACHISTDTALRRAGLLKTTQPIGPSICALIFSVVTATMLQHVPKLECSFAPGSLIDCAQPLAVCLRIILG